MDITTLEKEVELMHCQICSSLADPKRIIILYLLADGPLYVNELVKLMDCPQPTVSRHLAILRERELVNADRNGTSILYSIADQRILDALNLLRGILASQIAHKIDLADSLCES